VSELERRLSRSSRNSSLPPSQDPPSAPPRPRGKGSGRKRGGQQGHEGHHRRLVRPEQVDEFVEHWPQRCESCAREFVERERVDAGEPSRRQVAELPPIAVRVTEQRLHRLCCPECETVTMADAPALSRWAFGPRLQAAIVMLAVRHRVSRRATTELPGSCSASSCQPAAWTRSCSVPATRSPPHTRGWSSSGIHSSKCTAPTL
jgi:transposase